LLGFCLAADDATQLPTAPPPIRNPHQRLTWKWRHRPPHLIVTPLRGMGGIVRLLRPCLSTPSRSLECRACPRPGSVLLPSLPLLSPLLSPLQRWGESLSASPPQGPHGGVNAAINSTLRGPPTSPLKVCGCSGTPKACLLSPSQSAPLQPRKLSSVVLPAQNQQIFGAFMTRESAQG